MQTVILRSVWASMALLVLGALTYWCLGRLPGADPAVRQLTLEACERDVARRSASRQRVLHEVIDGRLTLAAAAARFQELDEASATFQWDHFREVTPGETDLEKQYHAVIRHVKGMLADDPDRAEAVTHRLEEELRALVGRATGPAPGGGAPLEEVTRRP